MATAKKQSQIPPAKLELYEKLIVTVPEIDRKGAVHPYTSVNGHMFTYLDQTGTLGIRLPKDELEALLTKYKTRLFESYGVVKKDWATVPDALLENTKELKKYLKISYEYVKALKPK
jgi:predicted DNA-binding protein (MmcQ/YjbR family)